MKVNGNLMTRGIRVLLALQNVRAFVGCRFLRLGPGRFIPNINQADKSIQFRRYSCVLHCSTPSRIPDSLFCQLLFSTLGLTEVDLGYPTVQEDSAVREQSAQAWPPAGNASLSKGTRIARVHWRPPSRRLEAPMEGCCIMRASGLVPLAVLELNADREEEDMDCPTCERDPP